MLEQFKGPVYRSIETKLIDALSPEKLVINNVSDQHKGHRTQDELESHFEITIVSNKFEGLSMIKRHKMVYQALKDELSNQVHALSIQARTPSEDKL